MPIRWMRLAQTLFTVQIDRSLCWIVCRCLCVVRLALLWLDRPAVGQYANASVDALRGQLLLVAEIIRHRN